MQITPAVRELNRCVEEFDALTAGEFDRVTDILSMAKLAESWPGSRIGLGDDLRAAHLSLAMHDAFRPWLPIWKHYL